MYYIPLPLLNRAVYWYHADFRGHIRRDASSAVASQTREVLSISAQSTSFLIRNVTSSLHELKVRKSFAYCLLNLLTSGQYRLGIDKKPLLLRQTVAYRVLLLNGVVPLHHVCYPSV